MTFIKESVTAAIGFGRAHAKIILIGEHTVLYGLPAIAIPMPSLTIYAVARHTAGSKIDGSLPKQPIDLTEDFKYRFTCSADIPEQSCDSGPATAVRAAMRRWNVGHATVEVTIRSSIPPARGLGSSAGFAAAAVRAVAHLCGKSLNDRALYDFVQIGERVAHGRASGVDAAGTIALGPIMFENSVIRPITSRLEAALVVADTGIAGDTRYAVSLVRATLKRSRLDAQRLLTTAAAVTESALSALVAGHPASLGRWMTEFHSLLCELGVSTAEIDRLIAVALESGAHGAKLSGSGLGGCVLALTDPNNAIPMSAALTAAGAVRTWIVPTRNWSS
jgi:mevalonate kinase